MYGEVGVVGIKKMTLDEFKEYVEYSCVKIEWAVDSFTKSYGITNLGIQGDVTIEKMEKIIENIKIIDQNKISDLKFHG